MNKETDIIVSKIVESMQNKKAHDIVVVDLCDIEGAVCPCFVICEGNTPRQVEAIADEVGEQLRDQLHTRPVHVVGLQSCQWVAMDYVDVMVHIFVPAQRHFYNLENLWADARLTHIPDLD